MGGGTGLHWAALRCTRLHMASLGLAVPFAGPLLTPTFPRLWSCDGAPQPRSPFRRCTSMAAPRAPSLSTMDLTAPAAHGLHGVQPYVSPDTHAKASQHSPTQDDDHHDHHDHGHWSAGEGSSADDGTARSQSGAVKRKRPQLSVSCETCKQRKVKCDRGHPACGWCLKNHSECIYLPRKKPGLRAGYGRELEARLGA